MRQCVTYIHDPDMMLTFDLKVKFIGFWHFFMSNPYLLFDTGISYLAHGSISMIPIRHWPFDLHVKFIGVLTWLCVRATTFLSFDKVIPYLVHQCITMVRCVTYIQNLCMTLTFGLNIKIIFSPWMYLFVVFRFLLIWRYQHYRCMKDCNCKFWPMLGTHGHWAVMVL